MYNVTFTRLRLTTITVAMQLRYIFWVCVYRLRYPACNAHAPYCHLWPARLYNIFPQCLINGKIFGKIKKVTKNKMCVLIFSTTLSETFFVLRRNERDMIENICWFEIQSPDFFFLQILMKTEFSQQIFEKYSNVKFHEDPCSGSRVVPSGRTDRH